MAFDWILIGKRLLCLICTVLLFTEMKLSYNKVSSPDIIAVTHTESVNEVEAPEITLCGAETLPPINSSVNYTMKEMKENVLMREWNMMPFYNFGRISE